MRSNIIQPQLLGDSTDSLLLLVCLCLVLLHWPVLFVVVVCVKSSDGGGGRGGRKILLHNACCDMDVCMCLGKLSLHRHKNAEPDKGRA
jgi:hypothetical protein